MGERESNGAPKTKGGVKRGRMTKGIGKEKKHWTLRKRKKKKNKKKKKGRRRRKRKSRTKV